MAVRKLPSERPRPKSVAPSVKPDLYLKLYERMLRAYYVEEQCRVFVRAGKCSFYASARGHEKMQILVALLLQPGKDWFFPYYREKALMVGLGMPLEHIFQGMLSREGDPNSLGRNMSEHFSSKELRVVSPTACTGTEFLIAVGMAKAVKAAGGDEIVYVSGGEGSTSEGEFFEALNKAQHDLLPVLFLIQNNGYAISVPQQQQTSSELADVARSFGMRSVRVDGTRFTEAHHTLEPLVRELRQGRGPLFVEGMVVRLDSHSSSDDQTKYRAPQDMEEARRKDPLAHTEMRIREMGILSDREMEEWRERARVEVEEAARKVDTLPYPDPASATADIFSADRVILEETEPAYVSDKPITMVEAINRGLKEEMARNPKIIMWGEDIQDPKGGVFGVTRGLTEAFPGRVENSPLAEATIVGVAQGMAIGGYKPVVEIQFGDYSYPAYMQIRNEISTLRWRSAGAWTSPIVVRVAVGGYIRGGPFHSQTPETLYAHTPGWYLAYPSNAADAKGLVKTACRMDDPILFFEHKGLYRQVYTKTPEPGPDYLIPFGKARTVRRGDDLTVVAWGRTVHMVQQALSQVAERAGGEPSVDLIDLRTIVPMDVDAVLQSVSRTGRALVVHEAPLFAGMGAEVAALIADRAFEFLDAPVRRVGARDSFVPFAPNLEAAVLPSVEQVARAIQEILEY
ncbi:MAG TPA: thiamine pyrophosphate-dependent enzyme [Candidatus Polarisedimenticolia bacterium]|jgi:2-oxoisovalerate dehydrogenase E1 component|nr:thiamine pyrophosphate-dependent enzyme [Candidatus Polarisedimenticolia bacterium]